MKQSSKRITTLVTGLIMAFGLIFSSCKKAETGPAGKDGNANVQSTGEVDLSSLTWTYQGDPSNDAYSCVYSNSAITQDVLDKGLVVAYIKTTDGWAALPFAAVLYETDDLTFEFVNGAVRFYYRDNNELTTTSNPTITSLITRIVIIPAQIKKPDVDHSDYLEVKEAYNL